MCCVANDFLSLSSSSSLQGGSVIGIREEKAYLDEDEAIDLEIGDRFSQIVSDETAL